MLLKGKEMEVRMVKKRKQLFCISLKQGKNPPVM